MAPKVRSVLWLACVLLPACGYDPKKSPGETRDSGSETRGSASDSAPATDLTRGSAGDSAPATDLARSADGATDADPGRDAVVPPDAPPVEFPDASLLALDASPTTPDAPLPPYDGGSQADAPRAEDMSPPSPDGPILIDLAPPRLDTGLSLPPDGAMSVADAAQADANRSCPVPTSPPNARVVFEPPIGTGTVASVECSPGYGPTTPVLRTCQADGTWSGQDPTCTPLDCGPPPAVTNGSRTYSSTTYQSTAEYTCNPGYVLSGSGTLSCQADGTWNPPPTCPRQQFKLTINKTGTGTGTVTGTGISCGSTCEVSLDPGAVVYLTAAAGTSQTFIGWESGLCAGLGACSFTITADTTIGAYFSPPPNIVFVTSTTHSANFGGLDGADAFCNERANAVGLQGTYRAWLSTAGASAASRMGAASGWVRPDGKPVFNRLSDIPLHRFYYPPRLDEGGVDRGHVLVMTATHGAGLFRGDAGLTSCGDFTSASTASVGAGYASANSEVFTSTATVPCQTAQRIYCLGVDRTALFLPPAPIAGRYAFTSKGGWTPGNGIASADAFCQSEATQASLPGTFKALMAANGTSAASRFNSNGPVWVRSDGIPLTASAGGLFTATLLDAAPNRSADGTQFYGTPAVWSGAQTMTAAGSDLTTCYDWYSDETLEGASVGEVGVTVTSLFFGSSETSCSLPHQLVCLQE